VLRVEKYDVRTSQLSECSVREVGVEVKAEAEGVLAWEDGRLGFNFLKL
jgi:hypothetical protein